MLDVRVHNGIYHLNVLMMKIATGIVIQKHVNNKYVQILQINLYVQQMLFVNIEMECVKISQNVKIY